MFAVRDAEHRFGRTRPAIGPATDEELAMVVADALSQRTSACNASIDEAVVAVATPWIGANGKRLHVLAQQQSDAALVRAAELLPT